ncbi:M23 family metallopeptidase [Pseudonocardiaceae bacterium YIM PH 21723]|nr:M23 family metallopeptidase [Pseudonocardiaceae bacterium YIM PH 21723]
MGRTAVRSRGARRMPAPPSVLRGRIVVAAVAVGAFAAAQQTLTSNYALASDSTPLAQGEGAAAFGVQGKTSSQEVLPLADDADGSLDMEALNRAAAANARRDAREAERLRPKFVRPIGPGGQVSSGWGLRLDGMHWGIDFAAPLGEPILAAADGVVLNSGPADGYGYWVRIKHADGTITTYGHMYSALVRVGQPVKAGQQIAAVGNNGASSGSHLHFQVESASGGHLNPRAWLQDHGIQP